MKASREMLLSCGFVLLIGISAMAAEREVGAVPADLRAAWKLSDFYQKATVADGFPILASAKVPDYALREAAYIVDHLLDQRDDLRKALIKHKIRLAVMNYDELTTMIPEHADLKPAKYWDKRARGLGATKVRPAVSGAVENLLEYPGDPYQGECICLHEFSHAIHEIALREVDPTFDRRLKETYERAMNAGLWKNTYAATNRAEYWAEAVQSWFHCNRTNDAQHNSVNSRPTLRDYDPAMVKLLEEVFVHNEWVYTPPSKRPQAAHLAGFDRAQAPKFSWSKDLLEWNATHDAQGREKANAGPKSKP